MRKSSPGFTSATTFAEQSIGRIRHRKPWNRLEINLNSVAKCFFVASAIYSAAAWMAEVA